MYKEKKYHGARFPAKTVVEAYEVFRSSFHSKERPNRLSISYGSEEWNYDTLEEFLAEYPKAKSFIFTCLDSVKDDQYWFYVSGNENPCVSSSNESYESWN